MSPRIQTHLPLVSKLPNLKASRYSFDVKPLGPGKAPYFCIFEAEFENEAALMGALGSREGKAVAGDVPNYASGGVTMMHFAVGRRAGTTDDCRQPSPCLNWVNHAVQI